MKKILALLLTLIFLTAAASSCLAEAANRKKIVVLATGEPSPASAKRERPPAISREA